MKPLPLQGRLLLFVDPSLEFWNSFTFEVNRLQMILQDLQENQERNMSIAK